MMYRHRILVFRIGALGDTLVSIPALCAVRKHFGDDAQISILRNKERGDLVVPEDLLSPHTCVDDFLEYPSGGGALQRLVAKVRLAARLRTMKFDAVVYLVPAQRSSVAVLRDRVFFRLCGIRRLLGFHSFSGRELFPRNDVGRPSAVRPEGRFLLDRLQIDGIEVPEKTDEAGCGLELTEAERSDAAQWLREKGWNGSDALVAIAPGSKHPINRWPIERFAEVGERLRVLFPCRLIVVGGPNEHMLGEELLGRWGDGINAAGAFPPRGTAALLEQCRVLIGLDTGTTHLAATVGTRCVALYSAKDNPGRWHPLGEGHQILRKDADVSCAGCMMPECPLPACKCMALITVEDVLDAFIQICGREHLYISAE